MYCMVEEYDAWLLIKTMAGVDVSYVTKVEWPDDIITGISLINYTLIQV